MGLREEIREELEEQEKREKNGTTTLEEPHTDNDSDDKDFHGIGWNILHKKFIEND